MPPNLFTAPKPPVVTTRTLPAPSAPPTPAPSPLAAPGLQPLQDPDASSLPGPIEIEIPELSPDLDEPTFETFRPGELQSLERFGPEPTFDSAREEISFFDSVGAAAMRENLTASMFTSSQQNAGEFTPDPSFNPFTYLKENSDRFSDLVPYAFGEEQDRFFHITSAEEFEHVAPFLMDEVDRIRRAEAGGFFPQMIGGVASLVFDPVSWVGGAGLGKAYQAWRVGSRLANTAKGALLGTTAAGIHEGVAQITQNFRTPEESMMAIGMGGVFGGVLGGVFKPSALKGEPLAHRRLPTTVEEVDQHFMSPNTTDEGTIAPGGPEGTAAAWDDSVGAARAAGADFLPAERSTTPLGLDLVSPLGRSIRRVSKFIDDFGAREGSEVKPHMASASRVYELHSEILERLLDTHIRTVGTQAGIAKGRNAETISKRLKSVQIERTANLKELHQEMVREVFDGQSLIARGRPKISRLQFENEVRTFRLMQDDSFRGLRYEPSADLNLTVAQREQFTQFVERANAIEGDYYDAFSKLMVDSGLLDEGALVKGYLPQVYNREAIAADPVGFKRLLRRLFMRDADNEWMRSNGFLDEGDTFDQLKARDPDAAEEAFAEWQAARVREMSARADEELEEAQRALGIAEADRAIAAKETTAARTILARKKIVQVREEAALKGRELSERRARRDRQVAEQRAVVESRGGAVAEARAREAARRIRANDATIRQLEGEVANLNRRLARAERAVEEAEALRLQSDTALKAADKVRRGAAAQVRRAERAVRTAAAAEARNLEDQVEAVYASLVDAKRTPFGLLPADVVGASGRIKQRGLNWRELILSDELRPFLVTEPERLSLLFSEDISPRVAMRQVFGSEDLADEFAALSSRFDEAETAARNAGDTALAQKITGDRQAAFRDLEGLRDRVLGRFQLPDNPNAASLWFSRRLREFNFTRLMGKVLLSSITDLAVGSLATQSGLAFLPRMIRNQTKLLKKIPSQELRALLMGHENSLYYARTLRGFGLDDAANVTRGIGTGTVRNITARVEGVAEGGVHLMNRLNGMAWWNKRTRVMFGTVLLDNMRRDFSDFANLPVRKQQMYLRRQIDADMAARIHRHFTEHGDEVDGVVFPNAERLVQDDPGAYNALVETITSVLDEALIVPGVGDLPFFMSRPMGALLLQFQSFAFAAVNRYLRPLVQQHDAYAAMNLVFGMGLGGLGYAARQVLKGEDGITKLEEQIEDSPQDLFYEALTRSPLAGPAPLPLDMVTKLFGPAANDRLADVGIPKLFPNTSRFEQRSAFLIPFGPSMGAAEQLWEFGTATANLLGPDADGDDVELFRRKGERLAPFANLLWFTGATTAVDAMAK